MNTRTKEKYESPETEVIFVSTENGILQVSGGDKPAWDPVNI